MSDDSQYHSYLRILMILILAGFSTFIIPEYTSASENFSSDSLRVLPETADGIKSIDMLENYLNALIDQAWVQWQQNFEKRISKTEMDLHCKEIESKFIEAIGDLPARTDLNPRVTGAIFREGYKVEKIIFESRPFHYVTAALFLPDPVRHAPPYPGILIPCGHYEPAKAHDEYQAMGALCALNGMAALIFDPIDQGERIEFVDKSGKTKIWGTQAHNLCGIQAILLGRNIAQYFIWDGIRALDYLISRSEINPQLIGVTGNSGGATQASYLFMLDKRITVAAPSCYIHHLNAQARYSMGDAEQNIFGQLQFGMDHPDYVMCRAPAPIKLLIATHDFFKPESSWETFRYAKRYFTALGYSERIDILENNAGHNYNRTQREGAVRWLARWLLRNDNPITEPDIRLMTEEEMYCTPNGNVMDLENARSVHDIHLKLIAALEKNRGDFLRKNPDEIRKKITELLSVDDLDQQDPAQVKVSDTITQKSFKIEKLIITNKLGIKLPALKYTPKKKHSPDPVLFISEEGKSVHAPEIEKLVGNGKTVLAVDLHGTGETRQQNRARIRLSENLSWEDCYRAYLLGKSIVGMRAEDILQCSTYLINSEKNTQIGLIAIGEVGVPALHAAYLRPDLFRKIKLVNTLVSWKNVIESEKSYNQLCNVVHGVLKYYDLPDLVEALGEKITVENPYDASGMPFGKDLSDLNLSVEPQFKGLAGILYGRIDFSNPQSPDPIDSLNQTWDNRIHKRGRDWASKWFGFLLSPFDGEVEISISSNQKVELEIGDLVQETLDYQTDHITIRIDLQKGRFYPIRITYSQDGVDNSFMKIMWNRRGQEPETIDSRYMRYSAAQKFSMENDWK